MPWINRVVAVLIFRANLPGSGDEERIAKEHVILNLENHWSNFASHLS